MSMAATLDYKGKWPNSSRRVFEGGSGDFDTKFSRKGVHYPFQYHNLVNLLSERTDVSL
jgi:hypothetical protein